MHLKRTQGAPWTFWTMNFYDLKSFASRSFFIDHFSTNYEFWLLTILAKGKILNFEVHIDRGNCKYSHLSNKCEVTLSNFEKATLHKKNPPSMFIDFLDFFHPLLLVYWNYVLFFPKNPTLHVYWFCNFCTPSTFISTSTVIREMRVVTCNACSRF